MNNWEQRQNDFQKSIQKYIGKEKREVHRSIGLLQEKTLHTVVKDFYAPSEDAKEIPINNYVADISFPYIFYKFPCSSDYIFTKVNYLTI